ncbi:MAG: cation:proton antiporter [Phycisphaerales bacterium]
MNRKGVFRALLMLGILVGFAWLGQSRSGTIDTDAEVFDALGSNVILPSSGLVGTAAGIGLFLLGAWIISRLLKPLGLPAVTAYLLFGVTVGPGVLGLVTSNELEYMDLIEGLAISLIALTAGGEIELDFIRSSLRKIVIILGVQMSAVALGCGIFAFGLLQWMGVEGFDGTTQLIAAAAILGTVAVTNSPAVLLAVMAETHAKGVMSQTALAATVCKDLVLIILFAIVMTIAGGVLLHNGGDEHGGQSLGMYLLIHLGGSLVAGLVLGGLFALYTVRIGTAMPIFLIFACLGIALIGNALHLDPLIVALVAGMVMGNLKKIKSDHFFETVEDLSLPVYCVFFAVAGAKLDLDIIASIAGWSAMLVAVRLAIVYGATTLGAKLAGLENPARTWLWTTLVPQAGVTLALATVVRTTLSDTPYVDQMFALLMGFVAANQVIGPILMKLGFRKCGESRDASGS